MTIRENSNMIPGFSLRVCLRQPPRFVMGIIPVLTCCIDELARTGSARRISDAFLAGEEIRDKKNNMSNRRPQPAHVDGSN